MDVEVLSVTPATDPAASVRAFATVRIGVVTVHGVRYVRGRNGPFVAMPARRDPEGRWHPHIELDEATTAAVFDAVESAFGAS